MADSKSLPTTDAAILALIAENPGMPKDEFSQLLAEVKTEDAASIARAIVDDEFVDDGPVLDTARALREWADNNRLHSNRVSEVW